MTPLKAFVLSLFRSVNPVDEFRKPQFGGGGVTETAATE
jgi:hypothetical protein